MVIRVAEESEATLHEYARVSIAFEVQHVLDVRRSRPERGEFVTAERAIATPWLKDYDATPDEGPLAWPDRFDLSRWGFFAAYAGSVRVGGAAVAMRSVEIEQLEGRDDLALLWDIRVAANARGHGVGTALLEAVESWTLDRGGSWLKAETQDINVPACRFYARHGFHLRAIDRRAYPDFPDETQLLWYKELDRGPD